MNSLRSFLLFTCAVSASLAADHNWSVGKVLDVNAQRSIVQTGTTFQSSTSGTATAETQGGIYGRFGAYSTHATTEVSEHSTTSGSSQAQHTVFQDNQIVIEGGGFLYSVDDLSLKAVGYPVQGFIGRAIANRKHGCRMVIGDPIQFEQEKNKLFVLDADGKVCKLDIVRQERLPSREIEETRR